MLVQTQTPLDLRASLRLKPHWTTLALAKAIHSGKLKAHFHTGIPVPCGTSDLFHTWVRVDDFKEYAARFHVDVSVGGIASKPDELKSIAAKGASASAPVAYKVEAAKSSDWKEQARAIADEAGHISGLVTDAMNAVRQITIQLRPGLQEELSNGV